MLRRNIKRAPYTRIAMIVRQGLSVLRNGIADLIFPPVCGFCSKPLEDPAFPVCPSCWTTTPRVEDPFCDRCGRPFMGSPPEGLGLCGSCLVENPPYLKARYAVRHVKDMRKVLINFKYYGDLHRSDSLGALLIEAFHTHYEASRIDSIIPIPLHPKRLCSRGYNQVVLLGEALSATTGIPLDRTSLVKIEDRPPQVGLSRRDRVRNVRGSFRVARKDRIKQKSILILDDVATTGATVGEAAKTVLRSGAFRVYVLVLALRPQWQDDPVPQESEASMERGV